MKAIKAFIKQFEAPERSVKIKINLIFYFNTTFRKARDVNPIQDGLFRGCSRMWGGYLSHISCNDETWKLGTVITYLKKIQKIYKSCDTPLEFQ